MLRVHLGPLQRVDNDIGGIRRKFGSLCGGLQPVVLISRHQHELAAAVSGDLDRFMLRLAQKRAEVVLEFEGIAPRHDRHLTGEDT